MSDGDPSPRAVQAKGPKALAPERAAAHTPGPWRAEGSGVYTDAPVKKGRCHGYGVSDNFICDLNDGEYHEYSDGAEQDANARLIAAAPTMLEAVKSTRALVSEGAMSGFSDPDWQRKLFEIQRILSAAIAKATGPQ